MKGKRFYLLLYSIALRTFSLSPLSVAVLDCSDVQLISTGTNPKKNIDKKFILINYRIEKNVFTERVQNIPIW